MSFSEIIHRIEGNIDTEVRALTVGIFGSIIKMTPVDTGRAKGNWQCTIGSPANGETDTLGEGAAMSAMIGAVPRGAGKCVFLTNNLPYIKKIEYGGYSQGKYTTSKTNSDGFSIQAPAGMVRVSINRYVD